MLGLISYGMGNIGAFSNILKNNNINYIIPTNKTDIQNCSRFILPGVGSFDEAMIKIKSLNYFDELEKSILLHKKKILGICVGMQVFLNSSEEGKNKGLCWVDGIVGEFKKNKRVPHMGWNKILVKNDNPIIKNISQGEFYFLHSYYCNLNDSSQICAETNYIENFCSILVKNNIIGVQFHPEKSHENGLKLLINFSKLI